jgi:hypothetical protein
LDKWNNVKVDINKVVYEGLKKLNYTLEYAEDRNQLVHSILNELDKDELLSKYFSSEGYRKKQVKNKNSFLSESEPLSKLLLRFSYYIDFAKFNNQEHELAEKKDKLPTLSIYKQNRKSDAIGLSEELQQINKRIIEFDFNNPAKRSDKNVRLMPKQEVNEQDRKEVKELDEYMKFLEFINTTLGFVKGYSDEKRKPIQDAITAEYGENYLRMLKRIQTELNKEIPLIKDNIKRTIYFKKLEKGSPEYNFDNDTGYFNENDDYVLVSENKIELNNPQHLFAIMDNYASLRDGVWDKPYSDLGILLYEFEQLVEKSNLEEYEKDIMIYKIDQMSGEEIQKKINKDYYIFLDEDKLSRIYNTYIPNKIAETYNQQYEEWLYTYKIKGEYKTCKKCNEVKLAKEKYFSKKSDAKDGLHPYCKTCR